MMETIGRYQIEKELGRGGMATVYLARDPRLDTQVAVKLLPSQFTHDPTFRVRFEREAKTIATLREHPAIVSVYDYGEQDDQPYIVMRHMAGGSLADKLENEGALPLRESATIIKRIASALDAAHKAGIIHRDLKPGNILFDEDGDAYLTDFGIVKLAEEQANFTQTGSVLGTPAYMSPEQAKGNVKLDGRSDTYTLGVLLYEILTGKQPYEADTPIGLAMAHVSEPIPEIRQVKEDLPAALDPIMRKVLAKDRDERYATAAAFARDVMDVSRPAPETQILQGVGMTEAQSAVSAPASSAPAPKATPTATSSARPSWLFPAIGLLLVAGLVGTFWFTRGETDPVATSPALVENEPTAELDPTPTSFTDPSAGVDVQPTNTRTIVGQLTSIPTIAVDVPDATIATIFVDSLSPTTDTGINLKQGDRVLVEVISGAWQAGPLVFDPVQAEGDGRVFDNPNFAIPAARVMTLLGRIGTSDPFILGNTAEFIAESDGAFMLGANDDRFDDNLGALNVRITHTALSELGELAIFANLPPLLTIQPTGTVDAAILGALNSTPESQQSVPTAVVQVAAPTATNPPLPTNTLLPLPTATSLPTIAPNTPVVALINTLSPTSTPIPLPTNTLLPTNTAVPTATLVPSPSPTIDPSDCAIQWFFSPAPNECPISQPVTTDLALQQFERGIMQWNRVTDKIYVFFQPPNDIERREFIDEFDGGEAESGGPEFDPPAGSPDNFEQPILGFGLVWRTHEDVREKLGFGIKPGQAYVGQFQVSVERLYAELSDGNIIVHDGNTWRFLTTE